MKSHAGYITQKIEVNNRSAIIISLAAEQGTSDTLRELDEECDGW